jgi:hypothetical protein
MVDLIGITGAHVRNTTFFCINFFFHLVFMFGNLFYQLPRFFHTK